MAANRNFTLSRDLLTLDGIYQGADSFVMVTISDSHHAVSLPANIKVLKVDPCPRKCGYPIHSVFYSSSTDKILAVYIIALPCEPLPTPLHGHVTGGNTSCHRTAVITCDECYNRESGSMSRTCRHDGIWTGSQPVCQSND